MNQSALITGGAKKNGKELVLHLAKVGWNVAIHYYKSEKDAIELYKYLCKKYPAQNFELFQSDLRNPLAAEALIPEIIKLMPNLSLLINSASIFKQARIQESPFDLVDKTAMVNFVAPFLLMRDFARNIEKGNIINLTNTIFSNNKSDYAVYTLSKKLLWELTQMAASEFAPNIRVNAISFEMLISLEDKTRHNNLVENDLDKFKLTENLMQTVQFIIKNEQINGQQIFCNGIGVE